MNKSIENLMIYLVAHSICSVVMMVLLIMNLSLKDSGWNIFFQIVILLANAFSAFRYYHLIIKK